MKWEGGRREGEREERHPTRGRDSRLVITLVELFSKRAESEKYMACGRL